MADRTPKNQGCEMAIAIRITRALLGESLKKFAMRIGVSYVMLQHYEDGRYKPKPEVMNRLIEILQESEPENQFQAALTHNLARVLRGEYYFKQFDWNIQVKTVNGKTIAVWE